MAATATASKTTPRGTGLEPFLWEGKDKRGQVMKGETLAKNASLLKAELRKQGITPITVKGKSKPLFGQAGSPISGQDIALFSRMIAVMMKSGVPLVQAMDIIGAGQKNPRMRTVIEDLRDSVSGGLSFTEALAKHPLLFDELYINLVRAGETAGVLDTVLDTIASYKENIETLKGKIKKAMFYPAAVVAVAIIVSSILLLFVIPQFDDLFKGFGAELPAFTQMVVRASELMQAYWWVALFGTIGAVVALLQAKKRSPAFAHFLDRLILKLPIVGQIMHNSSIARFSRTLAVSFRAGVPLVDALETVSGATGNIVYSKAVKRIRDDVAVGYQLNTAMRQVGLFPVMVVQMTAIGEEAGSLDTMLIKVAEYYEQEVNNAVDALSSLLEPLIMVILGVLIGGMVIAMYLPIFKLASAF